MGKKRQRLIAIALGLAALMLLAMGLEWAGYIPLWLYEAVVIITFPVFIIAFGLWWMAPENEEDIPFIGY